MAKVVELKKTLHARGAPKGLTLDDELDRSGRQPYFGHLEVREVENNPTPLKEKDQ